jgi:hypothetical protein
MRLPSRILVGCIALLGFSLTAQPAAAAFTPVTFTGTGTNGDALNNLSASAQFTVVETSVGSGVYDLRIVLTNTANHAITSQQVTKNNMVLTSIFFDVVPTVGGPATGNVSAGSAFTQATNVPGATNIGNEWMFKASNTSLGQGVTQKVGLSTVGLDIFGTPDIIDPTGPNLDGSSDLGQTEFGLVENGFVAGQGNGGTDDRIYIMNSATFTLRLAAGFTVADITSVRFQYGTDTDEPHFNGTPGGGVTPDAVPAPAGIILLATALPVLGLRRVLRRKTA